MKNIKKILYGILILFFFVSLFLDSNIIGTIYTRHISILGLIGLSLYDISNAYQINILRKYTLSEMKQNILLLSRLVAYGIVIILVASIQLKYIDYSYTLQESICSIYDQNHNLIYSTAYDNDCPKVEVISKTDSYLELFITDQIDEYYEELTIEDTPYKNIAATTKKEITVSISYDNTMLQYIHYRMDQWTAFEANTITLGYVNVVDQTIDYQDGYIFKEAINIVEFNSSFEDIMTYDASSIQFTDEDYEIKEYIVSEKLISENYIAYDVSSTQEETPNLLFEFLLAKDQLNSDLLTDYSISYQISEQSRNNGLVSNALSLSYLDNGIQMNTTMEYEGEGYYNTYLFSPNESLPILEAHHLNHIDNGETTYEGTTEVDTFKRGGKIFYYTNRTFTGEYKHFNFEKYHTIEKTDYGYIVVKYKYYRGTFTEFLFNKYEQDPYSYYTAGYTASIYQHQMGLFDSTSNPFYDSLNVVFITIPIYIQKTALE